MAGFKAQASTAPVILSVHFTAGEAADKQVFVADRDYELVRAIEVHRIAGAGSSTLMLEACASGTAPASGTDLLASAFALDSTADTPVVGTLTATRSLRRIAAGSSLACDFTGTVTAYEGALTIVLRPLQTRPGY